MKQPPQSGRQTSDLSSDELRTLLRKRRQADRYDDFATDPDESIRELGRLALRRDSIDDYFVLGDRCAQFVLNEGCLDIAYVAKTLTAYRRAADQATERSDQELARHMIGDFVRWVVDCARGNPQERNAAVALWLLAEADAGVALDAPTLRSFVQVFQRELDPTREFHTTETTILPELSDLPGSTAIVSQSMATVDDYSHEDFVSLLDEPMLADETRADMDLLRDSASSHRSISTHMPGQLAEPDDDEFNVGQLIDNRFKIVDIRRGGMGIVYLCYDQVQREPVAIKTFQSRFLNNQRAVTRFYNEAVTWVKLEKHRHVVNARLVQNINERPHIFLEHISAEEGYTPDLRGWIDHNRLDLAQSIEFGLHIALGMQHATRKVPGLVHRDLKPANILVTHDAIAKVTDFGLVRSLELEDIPVANEEPEPNQGLRNPHSRAPLTRVGAIVGTAPYMSPEQCNSQPVDMRSDIYAFGCLLFEMLTGRHVFDARRFRDWIAAHSKWTPRFRAEEQEQFPESLRDLTLFCLQKSADDRPADWGTIVDSLSPIYETLTGKRATLEIAGPALEARELMDKGYSLTELGHLDEALVAYDEAIALKPDYAWAWARRGRTLRVLGRYTEALQCYDRALEIQPAYAFAWNGKGIVLERMDQLDEALACYEKAAEINPGDVWHWVNQADIMLHKTRFDDAVTLLERALQLDPLHPNGWAKLGQVYRLLEDYPSSIKAYEQAIQLAPDYGWAHNGYGLSLKQNGQLDEALESFQRATRYEPGEVWHWYNVVETMIQLKRYEDAVHPAQRAVETDPLHASSWSKLGQVLRYVGRYEEALVAYDRSLALGDESGWVVNGKGIAYERMSRFEEALACYRQAATLGVWHAEYNQGNVLVRLGRYEEALPLLQRATQTSPDHARSWARLGSTLRHLKRYDEALAAYYRATEIEPGYAWAWSELGLTREAMGDYSGAQDAYRIASRHAPDDPLHYYQHADLLVSRLEHYQDALILLEKALSLDRFNPRFWAKHGQVMRRLNRYEAALTSYTRAVDFDPSYAWAWNGRGLTLSALKHHQEALLCFRKAAEIDGNDVWYWYNQGDELIILQRYTEGLMILNQALKVNPLHVESWTKRGQALRRIDQMKEALDAYDQALKINPRYDPAWNERGLVLNALGHREEALISFERAAQADSSVIQYYIHQVEVLLDMQRRDEALKVVDSALEVQPDNPNLWARRGQVLRRMGRFETAISSYQKALDTDPEYAWALNGQGLAYAALQRWEEALGCFERAIHYYEGDSWFWHNYGDALMMLGRYDAAQSAFEQALKINPEHERSKEKLAAIKDLMKDDD